MIENIIEINTDQLLNEVQKMIYGNFRFVTASCVDNGNDTFDVLYHFDKDLELVNLRIHVNKGEQVPSISGIYFCAVLVENEMKELFGLNVQNILLDYDGHMLLADNAPESPMAKHQIVIEKREG